MINNQGKALLLLLAVACSSSHAQTPPGYQGVVELEETALAFETSGRVRRLAVTEGDRVEAGAVIAELDDELARATRAARVLDVEAARSQMELVAAPARTEDVASLAARIRAARASEALLQKNLERQRSLFDKGAVPAASVDDLQAGLDRARSEREALDSQLAALKSGARREERKTASVRTESAEAALNLEDERLERHVLRAPSAGRLLDRHVELGEVVSAGAAIATLGDTQRPYVDIFVPEPEIAAIRLGAAAELRVDSEPKAFRGRVEHVARRTEFTPRYLFSERERPNLVVRVRIRIEDPDERLHSGVPAFVTIAHSAGARP